MSSVAVTSRPPVAYCRSCSRGELNVIQQLACPSASITATLCTHCLLVSRRHGTRGVRVCAGLLSPSVEYGSQHQWRKNTCISTNDHTCACESVHGRHCERSNQLLFVYLFEMIASCFGLFFSPSYLLSPDLTPSLTLPLRSQGY